MNAAAWFYGQSFTSANRGPAHVRAAVFPEPTRWYVFKRGDARIRGLTTSKESAVRQAALLIATEGGEFFVEEKS